MATNRTRIVPGAGGIPDSSGDVYWRPWSTVTGVTNDVWQHQVLTFLASGTSAKYYGTFVVPKDYNTSPQIIVRWASGSLTGAVKFNFFYVAREAGEASLDDSSEDETASTTETASTAKELVEGSISLTAGNFSGEDLVQFYLERNSGDAADTLAQAAHVFDVLFEYQT